MFKVKRRLLGLMCSLALGCGPDEPAIDTASSSGSSSGTTSTSEPTTSGPGTTSATDATTTTTTTTTTATTTTTTTTTDATTTNDTTDTTDATSTSEGSTTSVEPVFTPLALEVEDFDGDGEHDLLILGVDTLEGVRARLSRGKGDGTFGAQVDPMLTGASAFPAVGQLDGAGGTDVLMADVGNTIQIFRWTGDAFAPWKSFTSDFTPRTHRVVDATGDGKDDIAWLWWSDGDTNFGASIRPSGGGFFFAPVHTLIGSIADVGFAPGSLLIGPLNGDGAADALIFEADAPKGFLRVFGTPGGTFGGPGLLAETVRPWVARLGDFNEDGALDVLAVERTPARLVVVAGDGLGGLSVGAAVDIAAPFVPLTIDLADLDGDGHLDVVAVDDMTPEARIWPGKGDGTFGAPQSRPLPSGAVRVRAAPLDGDAVPDLALATFAAGDLTILISP